MMRNWQLQEAKARLSELVKQAAADGPQQITVHGKPAAVVLSPEYYEELNSKMAAGKKKPNFVEFMRSSPLMGLDLEFERDKDTSMRDIDLD